ncbi:hypothetical protein Tco_0733404 [Tanacetum coccineum]
MLSSRSQQDIYAAGSENRPPMLNKENYVPWSSRLLRTIKQMEADDLAIQTIFSVFLKDIYAAVDSCENAQDIWLRVHYDEKDCKLGRTLGIKNGYHAVRMSGIRLFKDAAQNQGVQNVGNQNGLIVVPGITNQNPNENGNVVAARARNDKSDNEKGCAFLQTQLLIASKGISRIHIQAKTKASTSEQVGGTVDQHPATVEETLTADESLAKHKTLELEIERLLRAVVSQDIMSIVQNPSVVDSSNLQTELDRTKDRLENFTSDSVPTHRINNVIATGMLGYPFKPYREKSMSLNKVRASVRQLTITVSQPHVVTKKDVNSDSNGLSSTGVDITA